MDIPPVEAERLWTDVERWPGFVEGFSRLLEVAPGWPEPGARVVWESIPGGRGRVTETVTTRQPGGCVVTEVEEDQMSGTQTVRFRPDGEGGTLVEVELEYELAARGPLTRLANAVFIRRAISDAIARGLRRFAAEAVPGR